jgi:hypothetical protein
MSRRRRQQFWLAAVHSLLVCVLAAPHIQGQAKPASPAGSSQAEKMTNQTRLQVIRSLQSERVFARVLFPQGDKGLKIKNGVVSPSDMAIAQQVAEFGPAAKPGDRCVITNVDIKEKDIIFEINGGPKKKGKWYQHIQVSGNGGASAPLPGTPSPQSLDAHGSVVTLEFDKYVPEMSGDQVRAMLAPVFDFKALTPVEAYQKTLSPKLQEAIKDHKILVGMDKEMVMYAKGRPQQRIRDKDDHGQDYEEWIYGKPPEEVNFVRFKGNEVARLEIMTVDGNKIVRTEREVDLPVANTEVAEQKPAQKQQQNAPTLRRPGEEVEYPTQGTTTSQRTPRPQDGQPSSGNSPYPNGGNSPYPNSGGSANPNATGGPVPPPSTTTPPINPNDSPHVAPSN